MAASLGFVPFWGTQDAELIALSRIQPGAHAGPWDGRPGLHYAPSPGSPRMAGHLPASPRLAGGAHRPAGTSWHHQFYDALSNYRYREGASPHPHPHRSPRSPALATPPAPRLPSPQLRSPWLPSPQLRAATGNSTLQFLGPGAAAAGAAAAAQHPALPPRSPATAQVQHLQERLRDKMHNLEQLAADEWELVHAQRGLAQRMHDMRTDVEDLRQRLEKFYGARILKSTLCQCLYMKHIYYSVLTLHILYCDVTCGV